MKLSIKVKADKKECIPALYENGDWIDLRTSNDTTMEKGEISYLSLGIAMKVPGGCEIHVASRSSTPMKHGILLANSFGIIDNSYCGNDDIIHFPAYALKDTSIPAGTRIAQFKVCLSQRATVFQKLRYLFSNGVKITLVDELSDTNRGGLGHSGTK
jgi:dUTP pyrophosphatase